MLRNPRSPTIFTECGISIQRVLVFLGFQESFPLSSVGAFPLFSISNHPPASAITGFWVDKSGTEWPTFICLLFSLPWRVGIIFEYRLPFFLACFALECDFLSWNWRSIKSYLRNVAFFLSGVVSPVTVDLTTTSRGLDGVGCKKIQISNATPSTNL